MGAGAVGCYFGALLARAGHAVTLIGRPAHVLAVRDHGLRLQTAAMDVQVPLAASTEASAVSRPGLKPATRIASRGGRKMASPVQSATASTSTVPG